MKAKMVKSGAQRTFVLVCDSGDDAVALLSEFARAEHLSSAQITGIGAFERAVLGYFEWQRKEYLRIPVDEQVEVLSLLGDVALGPDDVPAVHVHAVLGRRDGSTAGGHLLEATVRPTLELVVTESPAHLHKRKDPTTGLALIDLPG
jgi:predicted DNA-binding protein with PD1-like motif